jgi:hypothetical protein
MRLAGGLAFGLVNVKKVSAADGISSCHFSFDLIVLL